MFQTKISNPILECFSHRKKKKVGGKRRSSYLEQKEKTLVRYRLANVSITARDKYRVP